MAITNKQQGVWITDQVYNKQMAGYWSYEGADPNLLYIWGGNQQGQLGQNDTVQRSSPTQVGTDADWSEARGMAGQSYSIKTDGSMWSWGQGLWGRLGQNDLTSRSSPTQVGTDTTWRKLCRGNQGSTAVAIKTDNTLWSWGYDQYGQLGVNEASPNLISSPTQLPGTDWTDETCNAGSHVLAIKSNGTLWAWGMRAKGVLGNNQNNSPNPNGMSSPVQIGTNTNWSKVGSSGGVSVVIKDDNTLWVWGDNTKGCLGLNAPQPSHRSSPTQLPGTWSDAAMVGTAIHGLKTDGTLWAWGAMDNGILGLGVNATPSDDARSSPAQIGTDTTWSKLRSGNQMGICGKTDGTWWVWGPNDYGRYGLSEPNNVQRSSPAQIPGNWGELNHGPLGVMGVTA